MYEFDPMPVQEVYDQQTPIADYDIDDAPVGPDYQVNLHKDLAMSGLTFGQDDYYQTETKKDKELDYSWDHQRLHDNTNFTRFGNTEIFTSFPRIECSS